MSRQSGRDVINEKFTSLSTLFVPAQPAAVKSLFWRGLGDIQPQNVGQEND
jgi:hypothetical protein